MERAERIGLGVATAGHVLLFGALSVGFLASPNPLSLDRPPLEVQFVDEVGLEAATPRPSAQAPATSVAPELGPPEAEAAPPTPTPETRREQAAPAPSPAPSPRPAERKPAPAEKAAAKARPAPAKESPRGSRLGPDFLKGISDAASPSRSQETAAEIGPKQQAALAAELLRQLRPHWRAPSGADIEQLRVIVVARLNRDGTLAGEPRAEPVSGVTPSNRPQARLFAERAVAAVKLAAPYDFPADLYDAWKEIRPRFRKDL